MTDRIVSRHRIYNMDLERVLLILMVIVLHLNNRDMGGALNTMSAGTLTEVFVRLTESLSICAVDAFVIAAGYFAARKHASASDPGREAVSSVRIPLRKAVFLLVTCSFYRVAGYLAYVLFITHELSLRVLAGYLVPNNWFVGLFVTLLLLSPFIDMVLTRIYGADGGRKGTDKSLTGLLILLFSVLPTAVSFASDLAGVNVQGLSTVTAHADDAGYNIALFVSCYCIGYALYMHRDYWDRFSALFFAAMYLMGAALTAAISRFTESAWNYSCITVLFEAVMLTLSFTRVHIGSDIAGRIISSVSESSLGIFLWHTMPVMLFGLWPHFDIAGSAGTPRMFTVFAGATLLMYLLSFMWVFICRKVYFAIYLSLMGKKNNKTEN